MSKSVLDQFTAEQLAEITEALAPVVKETKTVKEVFSPLKDSMVKEYKRFDKLVKAYFRLGLHDALYKDIDSLKYHNKQLSDMFFAFGADDISKVASMLRQIFQLNYFRVPSTPVQFVNELKALLTSKEAKKRSTTLTFERVVNIDDDLFGLGNFRADSYKVKHSFEFSQDTVKAIFEAYTS